ncbi:hypothetical protein ACH4U6_25880 [Streptomyces netropsis]|uniref:hypothetical protein n=1 Tax=Streptomyces netropsis TaxID=55404 RepID=UPI0037BB3CDF
MPPTTTPGLVWSSSHTRLLGTTPNSPCASPQADGRIHAITQYSNNGLGHRWLKRDGSWADWEQFINVPNQVDGVPAALRDARGLLHIFWRDANSSLWWLRQKTVNADWAKPEEIASRTAGGQGETAVGVQGNPAPALNADGRISVFFHGTDGALWHVHQQGVDHASWSRPQSLCGSVGQSRQAPGVARAGDGRLHAFVTNAAGEVDAVAQAEADATDEWGPYVRVSPPNAGVTGSPSAATDANQRIRVFWLSGTTAHHAAQCAGYTGWGASQALSGSAITTPRAALAQDGRLEAFVLDSGKGLCVARQKAVNSSDFTSFESLNLTGITGSHPITTTTSDNRIAVVARGSDQATWVVIQQWS